MGKFYFIFGLTDETFGLLTSIESSLVECEKSYVLYLTGLNQSYWVISTAVGALLGTHLQFNSHVFVVFCIERYKKIKSYRPFAFGGAAGMLAIFLVPTHQLLIVTFGS